MTKAPQVEQVEMNEITEKASRVAESRTACLVDESLRIARANNQDPFRTLAISAYLQGFQDALTPPETYTAKRRETLVTEYIEKQIWQFMSIDEWLGGALLKGDRSDQMPNEKSLPDA